MRAPHRAARHTPAGKLFATVFALCSGVVFLVIAGLLTASFVHRLLHRLHVDRRDNS